MNQSHPSLVYKRIISGILIFSFIWLGPVTGLNAAQTSFAEVTAYLDAGGDSYQYQSMRFLYGRLDKGLNQLRDWVLNLAPMMQPKQRSSVESVYRVLKHFLDASGIEELSGYGMSSIEKNPGFFMNKTVLYKGKSKDTGMLWSLFGKENHALNILNMLPVNCMAATSFELNLKEFWSHLMTIPKDPNHPDSTPWQDVFVKKFMEVTQTPLEKVLDSLGNEYGFCLFMDDSQKRTLQIDPQNSLSLPDIALALMIKIKDDTLYQVIGTLLGPNPAISEIDMPNFKMKSLALPVPIPVKLVPSIACCRDYLILGTSDSLVQELMNIHHKESKGLVSSKDFISLSEGISSEGVHFYYLNSRLSGMVSDVLQQISSNPKLSSAMPPGLTARLAGLANLGFSFTVSKRTEEAFASTGWSDSSTGIFSMNPLMITAVIGLLVAIGVPGFIKARDKSRLRNIRSNLRTIQIAKERWAAENNKSTGDPVDLKDLSPYFPLKSLKNVSGEIYQPNPVGTEPCAMLSQKIGKHNAGSEFKLSDPLMD
ncbi:MAG: hypothetical protein JW774_10675 [Candidatus Aureabacteria bacterium]|nr:hypothetical protein [Candidatus Auribacterota bacterium]